MEMQSVKRKMKNVKFPPDKPEAHQPQAGAEKIGRKNTKIKQTRQKISEGIQQATIKEFYKKALLMQEEERRRISRDLHDETGQMVIALGTSLNVIEKELKAGHTKKALKLINENRELIQAIAAKMKSMALNLRPPALDILGLSAVLREYFSQWTKVNPIRIEFNENSKGAKLNGNIEITLYRIVQEAVCNILKHAEATAAKVDLIYSESKLQLIIEDNGKGFNVGKYASRHDITRMGLQGIKERVDILNGTFSIKSASGTGTKLIISLPLGCDMW